jgi:hypothetical protein
MEVEGPSPQTTLVILLGASEWPGAAKNFPASEAFTNSANDLEKYFLDRNGFDLPKGNLLNLFDSTSEPSQIITIMDSWLVRNAEGSTDLLIYFVGHGHLAGRQSDFLLAIRSSKKENLGPTSLRMVDLANTIKERARNLRCIFILDCCFAASAHESLQQGELDRTAIQKTTEALASPGKGTGTPRRGISLLCSSSSSTLSRIAPDESYTMFTEALLHALNNGDARLQQQYLSLDEVAGLVEDFLLNTYPDKAPRPEVHSPDQRGGIVANIPFFPNLAVKVFENSLDSGEKSEQGRDTILCYVVLSETERKLKPGQDALLSAVEGALDLLEGSERKILERAFATDIVANLDTYEVTIKKLCWAEVAIFDITQYEPAVMLLLGIRSVVRRGVTIASVGENYVIGDVIDLPFNIKEVNITSHSSQQNKRDNEENWPTYIIRNKIQEGLQQLQTLPQYLDLPAFDAVRNLPPGYREPDPDNVLLLCSYGKKYQEIHWNKLKHKLREALDRKDLQSARRANGNSKPTVKHSRVLRVLDLVSPRLVSPTIYEAIRRKVLCIADWTEWRPNVFFELGVRLAVTKPETFTVSIIEDRQEQLMSLVYQNLEKIKKDPTEADTFIQTLARVGPEDPDFRAIRDRFNLIAPQCMRLLDLFKPLPYICPPPDNDLNYIPPDRSELLLYQDIVHYHRYTPGDELKVGKGREAISVRTYEIIEKEIDVNGEIVATPVYIELLRTAQLFEIEESEGRAAVLYPNNGRLKRKVEIGTTDRYLAAWYFIRNEYTIKEIIEDDRLLNVYQDIGDILSRRLNAINHKQAKPVYSMVQILEDLKPLYSIMNEHTEEEVVKNKESKLSRDFEDIRASLSRRLQAIKPEQAEPIKDLVRSLWQKEVLS